jgi:hypothetical protein
MENQSTQQYEKQESPLVMWLRHAADRHDLAGRPVWASLYRQEAHWISEQDGTLPAARVVRKPSPVGSYTAGKRSD